MSNAAQKLQKSKRGNPKGLEGLFAKLGFLDTANSSVSDKAKKKLEITKVESDRRSDHIALQKANKLTLENIILQSGLDLTLPQYMMYSIAVGGVAFAAAVIYGLNLLVAIGIAIIAGLGLPRWYVIRARSKRLKSFNKELPYALEAMVRSLKSGIPSLEAIKILSREAKEPIRSEFATVLTEQGMGLTLAHAFQRLAVRIPSDETRFLAITIEIQAQSGGNLSEILQNLAQVLRARSRMKQKVKSMTAESRGGAMIIGGIPFAILGALSVLNPPYVKFFFEDTAGIMALSACFIWQMVGLFVMWKMTNFKV